MAYRSPIDHLMAEKEIGEEVLREYITVRTRVEKRLIFTGEVVPVGTLGTIVEVFDDGEYYDVEFWDKDGNCPVEGIAEYDPSEIEEVTT